MKVEFRDFLTSIHRLLISHILNLITRKRRDLEWAKFFKEIIIITVHYGTQTEETC